MSFSDSQKQLPHVREIHRQFYSDLIMRLQWGPQHQDGFGNLAGFPLRYRFLHHTVTAQLPTSATYAQDRQQILTVERIGQQNFGVGMSYTMLSPPSGRCFQGVSFSRVSPHTLNYNSRAHAFVLVGNNDVHDVSDAQIETAARACIANWVEGYWAQPSITNCHSDVFATACPGRYGCRARTRINQRAAELIRDAASNNLQEEIMSWSHRGIDYLNENSSTKDNQLARNHQRAYRLIRTFFFGPGSHGDMSDRAGVRVRDAIANPGTEEDPRSTVVGDDDFSAVSWRFAIQRILRWSYWGYRRTARIETKIDRLSEAFEAYAEAERETDRAVLADAVQEALAGHDKRALDVTVRVDALSEDGEPESDGEEPDDG